ncbi:MAG: hypothetical protein V1914_01030 [archaeon]
MKVGKTSIKPTKHYLEHHINVEWDKIILTILSPTKILLNKRHGKDRLTFIRKTKNSIIKVHAKREYDNIWVINAFEGEK